MNTLVNRNTRTSVAERLSTWQVRALAVVAAILTNVVIMLIGRAVNGEFPIATVSGDDQSIALVEVVFSTAMIGLIAWGLLSLLERITSRAKTIWTVIAVIFLAISMTGPLAGGVNTSSKVVLTLLHIGAAATIITLMRSSVSTQD